MRKLKLQVHMTIDGFGARKNGQNDWVFFSGPDEAGFQKLISIAETCDTVLMGRNMAPTFLGYWQNMADSDQATQQKTFGQVISNMRKIVFSRTESTSEVPDVEVESGELLKAINTLKNEEGKDIIVYGCGEFVLALIQQNLIDEYILL